MDNGEVDKNNPTVSQPLLLSDGELLKFQRDYSKNGKYKLNAQVPLIEKLADRYLKRYESERNWVDTLKSHSLYNSVGYRRPKESRWTEKAFQVQQACLGSAAKIDFAKSQDITIDLSARLQKIRDLIKVELQPECNVAREFQSEGENPKGLAQQFGEQMKRLSLICTKEMHSLAKEVFKYSVESLVQEPPCGFEVVSIGSMARGEVTPYSDLEYIFLIEQKYEDTIKYFEDLAMMSYFIIGNLQETRLTNMAIPELYGWFDDQQMCGFRIDSLCARGGYIPTGNGEQTKNRFILTPNELLNQYSTVLENPVEEDVKKGDLTSVLQYTSVIFLHGKANLLNQFVSQKKQLDQNLNQERKNANILMFQEDTKKYNFRPDTHIIANAHSVNSKKELYRYPSILLFNISILTGTCHSDSWTTLQSLFESQQISESLHQSLSFLLACSCYVRLSTYLSHNSQDDRVSVLPTVIDQLETQTSKAEAGRRWHLSLPLFLEICLHTVSLKEHINKCQSTDILELIRKDINPPSWLMKFQALHCCHRWLDAWELFRSHFTDDDWSSNPKTTVNTLMDAVHQDMILSWFTIKALGYTLSQQRLYSQALGFHSTFLKILQSSSTVNQNQKDSTVADLYNELGFGNAYLSRHLTAVTNFEHAIEIYERCDSNPEQLAKSYGLTGRCLREMKEHDKAESHLIEALQIHHSHAPEETVYDYYGDPIPQTVPPVSLEHITSADARLEYLNNPSIVIADVLWDLGCVYLDLKWYQRALMYYTKAKEMEQELFGHEAYHKDLAATYHWLGYCNTKLGNLSDADLSWRKGLMVIIQIFGNQTKVEELIAAEKSSHESEIGKQKYYEMAVSVFFDSLPGYKESHVESAEICVHAAAHMCFMKQHELAHSMVGKATQIYKSVNNHGLYTEDVAKCKSVQGLNFWKSGDISMAAEMFAEALSTLREVDTRSGKLEAAETLQNTGLMYIEQKCYNLAESNLAQSQTLYIEHCKDEDHPKLSEIQRQLRDVRKELDGNSCDKPE